MVQMGSVSDLNAWVYAREYDADSDDDFYEIVAEVPLTSRGTFSFPGVSGEYIVGLWLPLDPVMLIQKKSITVLM